MNTQELVCFSIGHSRHSIEAFAALVKPQGIDMIIDVRSKPNSRFAAQFNRKVIRDNLAGHELDYEFLGDLLGGMITDKELLNEDGSVDNEKITASAGFQQGLDKVIASIREGRRVAIMCAEKDPHACHRYSLISPALEARGVRMIHLLADGGILEE